MRLLFLSFAFPLPANNGHKMRTWSVLEALSAEGHRVTLLTFGQSGEDSSHRTLLGEVCQECEIVPMVLDSLSSATNYVNRLIGMFCAQPFTVRRFASPVMQARIREHLARHSYDAIFCDTVYSAANLPETRVPIILNSHDVEHLVLERYFAIERNPVKRLYAWSEMRKLRRWERETCQRAAAVLACSEHDRQMLSSLCSEIRVTVVPNVVDVDRYIPTVGTEASTVLFQGAMDWFPNRDAVSFFAAHILPTLRQHRPSARFVVAGRNPAPDFVAQFSGLSGIEFTGTLPDMGPEIAKASVCVVPLRIGSGTRLKILEAAAMAKPIVSTRIGAEGLDFVDGEEILLADEPRQFARSVSELLADPERRRAIGNAARRRVELQYSAPVLRRSIHMAIELLAEKPSPPSQQLEFTPTGAEVRS